VSTILNRREALGTLSLGAVSLALRQTAAAPAERPLSSKEDRPNVLLLMTDQQTLKAVGAYGNKYLRTPAMDSITASGVRFEKSYCTAPVCGPSRSSILTARMPHQTGVEVNGQSIHAGIPNLGEIFRQAGYETAWAGKWHLPASYPRGKQASIDGFDYLPAREGTKFGLGADSDDPVADEAVKFLRKKHSRPFLLGVSLHNPHDICSWVRHKPIKHPDLDSFPPLPPNFAVDPNEPEFIQDCRRRRQYGPEILHTKNWDKDQWRAYLQAYYRLTEEVDRTIGRVLAALREEGLEDDMLIVFTSDHGEGAAGHQWVVKLMLYEEPVTVPLIVSRKGVTPAGVVDKRHLVSGLDVLPTICDYAGIGWPRHVAGYSLRPLIEDPTLPGRQFVVAELQPFLKDRSRKGRMLRTQQFKYVAFSDGRNPEMLFDLEADPGETRNLARLPAMQNVLKSHRSLLRQWVRRSDDQFEVPSA